ncbi:MAG: sensor histidine kinase [Phycisphaerales bacterium]
MAPDARLEYDREQLLERLGELEEHVQALRDDLDRSHRLATLGVLTGMVAHELNNLLTPITNYAHLALKNPDDREGVTKSLERVNSGVERISEIAASILGFLKTDDQLQSADVNAVIDESLNCLPRTMTEGRVKLERRVSPGFRVQMRPLALQQVILNLVANAFEAIKRSQRGGRIEVSAEMLANGQALIRIRDNGPGLPDDIRHRAFEPFVRSGDDSAGDGNGAGLGLAICRRLIEEAGGRIRVDSDSERGTVFTIELKPAIEEGRRSA